MNLSRRGFIGSLAALVAAPAIVRVENLMALPAPQKIITSGQIVMGDIVTFVDKGVGARQFVVTGVGCNHFTIDMITREAVQLFKNTNAFIQHIDQQYEKKFAVQGARIGSQFKINLPKYFLAPLPRRNFT